MTQWKLIIEDDAGKTIVVPLTRDEVTIGRKEGNTIRLTERNVSRGHAKLTKANGMVSIEDLQSFNGIKINGDRINGRVEVREGDLIEIGDYHLALQAEGTQDAPTVEPTLAVKAPTEPETIQGPVGSQAGAVGYEPADGSDEFAGDTQRWDPPVNGELPSTLPTLADKEAVTQQAPMVASTGHEPADDELTIRNPTIAPSNTRAGFSDLSGEKTEALTDPSQEGEPHLASAPVAQAESLSTAEMTPTNVGKEATTDLGDDPAAHSRLGPRDEMTEQIRAAPGLKQDLSVPRLVVLNSMFAGSTYHVQGAQQVIGRTDDNDITIGHRSVSRNHAKIVRDGNTWAIHDMKSANGILVNNKEVDGFRLGSGDVIELGRIQVRFVPPNERFALTPSEVEAARQKAAMGEEDEPSMPLQKKGNATVLVAAGLGAVILLLLVVVIVLLFKGDGKETAEPEPKTVSSIKTPIEAQPKVDAQKKNPVGKKAVVEKAIKDSKSTENSKQATKDDKSPAPKVADKLSVKTKPVEQKVIKQKVVDKKPVVRKPVERKPPRNRKVRPKNRIDKAKANDYFMQGTQAQMNEKFSQARDLLQKAIKNNPRHADAHRNLGAVYAKIGKSEKAYRFYSRYLVLKPSAQDRARIRAFLDDFDRRRGR